MNRDRFIGWAQQQLLRVPGASDVRREDSNNAQAVFFDDVHIGVVATKQGGYGDPGPRVRVHIWSEDPERRVAWNRRGVELLRPPYPQGCDLVFRLGPKNPRRFYLEFGWDNDDLDDFTCWLTRVEACLRFFVIARNAGLIPST